MNNETAHTQETCYFYAFGQIHTTKHYNEGAQ